MRYSVSPSLIPLTQTVANWYKFTKSVLLCLSVFRHYYSYATIQSFAKKLANDLPFLNNHCKQILILDWTNHETSPTQIDDTKIENQPQNANYRCDYHVSDNQADEKRD